MQINISWINEKGAKIFDKDLDMYALKEILNKFEKDAHHEGSFEFDNNTCFYTISIKNNK
jgi:hypothetical protein